MENKKIAPKCDRCKVTMKMGQAMRPILGRYRNGKKEIWGIDYIPPYSTIYAVDSYLGECWKCPKCGQSKV